MTKKKNHETEENLEEQQTAAEPQEAEAAAEPMNEAQAAFSDLNNKYIRILAEYDNFRKRSQKEREGVYSDAQAATVSKFLPILDTLDLALQQNCGDEEYKKGIDLIVKQFREALEKMGVVEIPAEGQPFDPNLHDAVMHVENDDLPENTIAIVMRKGYTMGDRVIRHAMVQVAN